MGSDVENYLCACFLCAAQEDLLMFAHRNELESIVGWLFVCADCQEKIASKHLDITINIKDQPANEIGGNGDARPNSA